MAIKLCFAPVHWHYENKTAKKKQKNKIEIKLKIPFQLLKFHVLAKEYSSLTTYLCRNF